MKISAPAIIQRLSKSFCIVPPERLSTLLSAHVYKDGYNLYRLSYQTEKDQKVSAWLLVPENAQNAPAVVACHQHADEYFVGKSEPAGLYKNAANTFGVTFCKAGYVVICPDQIGFEDRRPSELERRDNPFMDGVGFERWAFMERLLHGSTLQAKAIFDLTCAVDSLCQQPEVDVERIGVCGHSLGGQEALWLAWYDARIKVAVTSCGYARIQDLQVLGINHNFAMYLPGFLEKGDMDDVVAGVCPKPLYILHGAKDTLYPLFSVQKVIKAGKHAYEKANVAARFSARIFPNTGHVFEEEQQACAVAFLQQWL